MVVMKKFYQTKYYVCLFLLVCGEFAKNIHASHFESTALRSQSSAFNLFSNSLTQKKAYDAYVSGDFKQAESNYVKLLADNPYDAQNNYNLGNVLHKQKKFDDAEHYFHRAIEHAQPKSALQEQALFNRGNNFVQQKKLDDAIKDYKEVLKINPDNQSAKKNLEAVQQMKKEQKKQDQQQSKDKNQKNSKQDQEQQSNNNSDSKSSDTPKDQTQNQQNRNNTESKQQDRDDHDKQQEQEEKKKEQEKGLEKTKKQKSKSGTDERQKQEQQADHKKSSQTKDSKESTTSNGVGKETETNLDDAYAQDLMTKPSDDERLEKRSAMLLEKLDDYEKNIQKKLLQMNVTKQGVQKHGQKNW
jgi:Ca-activated chloride channel homolog